MELIVKSIAILIVAAFSATIWDRWYNIFFQGRLYEHSDPGIAMIGWTVPVITMIGAAFLCIRIIRFR